LPNVLAVMSALIVPTPITSRTTLGRRVYAVGGNEKAAACPASRRSAVLLHLRQHGRAGRAGGLIFAARLNTATPRLAWASSWT
jgi:putative multiple sugar transport system permease protein